MQEKSTYTPTSGALSGESFEEQTVNKFKAQKTWQSGNVLPVGIEDQEIWLHTDESGKQLLGVYRYDASKPAEFGTLILGAFATNEELDKSNPTEAELVELAKKIANARQLVERLNLLNDNKADLTLSNVTELSAEFEALLPSQSEDPLIDYYPKTEEEKAEADGSWWRKYKSGWIEQGFIYTNSTGGVKLFDLLVPYTTTNYMVLQSYINSTYTSSGLIDTIVTEKSTTTFKCTHNGGIAPTAQFSIKGY